MKTIILKEWPVLVCVLVLSFFLSCRKDSESKEFSSQQADAVWETQLKQVLTTGNDFLKESSLKMTGYKEKEILASRPEIERFKNSLLTDEKVLPDYSPVDLKDLQLIKIGEIKRKTSGVKHKALTYDITGSSVFLDSVVKIGQKIIEIAWENNGVPFTTQAVVDDKIGIIYDNLISNIMIIKEEHEGEVVLDPNKATLTTDICISMPFPEPGITPRHKTVSHGWTAQWLWGSDRGEARVSHTVEGYTDTRTGHAKQVLTCSAVDAYSYMTLGKGDAKIVNHSTYYGEDGSSSVHWGLYLAAPTVSISMTYSPGSGFSITLGTALGSELHHTGSEFISALHFQTM
ncbi:hypothetical protein [Arcticibacter tournemirensis]